MTYLRHNILAASVILWIMFAAFLSAETQDASDKLYREGLGFFSGQYGKAADRFHELIDRFGRREGEFVLTDDPPYLKKGDSRTGIEIPDHAKQILDHARSIESNYGRQVKINTICYKPWDNEKGDRAKQFLKKLARRTGGHYKLIKRK